MVQTFVALWLTVVPPAHAQVDSRALTKRESCEALLAPDPAADARAAHFLRELTEHLTFEKSDALFIERLRAVTDDLIRQNRITPTQAEHQFADRVLGQFAPIFTKFVVAELKHREYDEKQTVDFILHFEDTYTPEVQVDFALAVTRRMLMAINDVPPASNPAGLAQFLTAVESFGVTTKSYAQFLQIWAQVRSAHPRTVVQFILANVKNAGERVRHEVERREIELDRPAPVPRWYHFAFWPRDAGPARPTSHQIALATLDGLHVPEFLVDVEDLHPAAPRAGAMLDQLLDETPATEFENYLERLALRSPFIWDHVLRQRWEGLNSHELGALAAWSEFGKLSPELATLVDDKRARFARLDAILTKIRAARAAEERATGALTLGRGEPSFKTINRFIELFSLTLLDQRTRQPMDQAVGAAVSEAFATLRKLHPRLDAADFLSITRKVIEMTFVNKDGAVAVAALKSLVMISRDYDVTTPEARDLLDLAQLYPLQTPDGRVTALPELHGAAVFADAAKWGRPRAAAVVPGASVVPGLLIEFRAQLPADEARRLTDERLAERLTPRPVPAAPAALEFWNQGIIN